MLSLSGILAFSALSVRNVLSLSPHRQVFSSFKIQMSPPPRSPPSFSSWVRVSITGTKALPSPPVTSLSPLGAKEEETEEDKLPFLKKKKKLTYDVVLVSGVQQSELHMYNYTSYTSPFFFPI